MKLVQHYYLKYITQKHQKTLECPLKQMKCQINAQHIFSSQNQPSMPEPCINSKMNILIDLNAKINYFKQITQKLII